jgi:hypothetical protein
MRLPGWLARCWGNAGTIAAAGVGHYLWHSGLLIGPELWPTQHHISRHGHTYAYRLLFQEAVDSCFRRQECIDVLLKANAKHMSNKSIACSVWLQYVAQ